MQKEANGQSRDRERNQNKERNQNTEQKQDKELLNLEKREERRKRRIRNQIISYLVLAVLRLSLILNYRHKSKTVELRCYRWTAWLLLTLNGLFFTLRMAGTTGSFPRALKREEEQKLLEPALDRAAGAALEIVAHGVEQAANEYNGK